MSRRQKTVHLEGAAKQALETGRNRLLLASCLLTLAFIAVGGRVINLSAFRDHNEPTTQSVSTDAVLQTGRADIVDRNGLLMATSLRTPSLYADPTEVLDAEEAAATLTRVLTDLAPAEIVAKLRAKRRFVWLKRSLTPREQHAVNRLGIPGLYFMDEWKRVYPQGELAAHAVGFTDADDRGIAGIEKSFDDVLRGGQDPLRLALDLRVQHIVRSEVARQIEEFEAIGGTGVVLDARTGETIAMVSLPDFDPNVVGRMESDARFNRATLGVYEMGSTFKIFNTAMALDAGTERQRAFLGKLGFLTQTALEVPERGRPMAPSPWRPINTMTISFGLGIAVSPIHLASGVASVVNGGIRRPVTLLAADVPAAGERVLKASTSRDMRRLMRLVVENGTGRKANAEGYVVGGKTGTAEKSGGRGGYKRKSLLSSFVAAFPMNAPRYVVLVMVDEPKGQKQSSGFATGGWVAAPAVKRIVERAAPLLGVAPVDPNSPEIRRDLMVEVPTVGGKRLASF